MIAWFARNGVAANILMVTILGWGLFTTVKLPLEVFPSFELDQVTIRVPFRGATPAEVEEGVVVRVEEALEGLSGIKRLVSSAREGSATTTVEVDQGFDPRQMLEAVRSRVDAISTFPAEAERAQVTIPQREREVISVMVIGALSERELRGLGERIRDALSANDAISRVELDSVRDYELAIEISERTLRRYGLVLADVAAAIERGSLDLAAGSIRSAGGEILLRTKGQAYQADDFAAIVVRSNADGTRLTVGDLARIEDGFAEDLIYARCNGKPCVMINVYRIGQQNAIHVARAVKEEIAALASGLPEGVELTVWRDRSKIVDSRLETLLRSAVQGGVLVLLLLTLFLRWSVAFWVFIGVPVSFMGGIALMPLFGVTINIVSLFAFILVLGIVVDDAIVTGENIYTHLQRNPDRLGAAIDGTREVAVPVTFGVLTTVAAFTPMLWVEGVRGQIFAQIPLIVIPVLLFSLVESKWILPSHLSHLRVHADRDRRRNVLVRVQRRVATALEWAIRALYRPVLAFALHHRYTTLAVFIGGAIIASSVVYSGHLRFVFWPRVQSEVARATLTMPAGTPLEVTAAHIERMSDAAQRLREKYTDPRTGESIIAVVLSTIGARGDTSTGWVGFEIVPPEHRRIDLSSAELVREWREQIGPVAGATALTYRAEYGRGGDPIEVRLTGTDFGVLRELADAVQKQLTQYPAVFDLSNSFDAGKQEIQLTLRPEAQLLGVSLSDLARQVRQAFFGDEVQRLQRGRDEVRVVVRLAREERRSLASLESMRIRTPAGVDVPFDEVATATLGRSFASIERVDRRRTVEVTADVNKESANIEAIKADLNQFLSERTRGLVNVGFSLEGEAREQRESFGSLRIGALFTLFVIYTLLAIPFRSYLQPLMVMSVIPFGVVGAILGHLIMGLPLSIVSVCGMLALTGVVVNDSLVLVDYTNRRCAEGMRVDEAILSAGVARFRPVMLTSLTTFAGLTPIIFEKSTQAQFLIPMAVSLGFGILFATAITLVLIPINYRILDDLQAPFRRARVARPVIDRA